MSHAIVAGATGAVGAQLLDLLLEHPRTEAVLAVGRRALGRTHPKLASQVVDFTQPFEVPRAVAAFCCLGTTLRQAGSRAAFRAVDHDAVLQFAQAAHRAGVPHFLVVSAIGADPRSLVFYNRVKGETERDLQALGFPRLTLVQPSLLLGRPNDHRPLEAISQRAMAATSALMKGPLEPYAAIHVRDVAKAMLRAAARSEDGVRVLRHQALMELAAAS